MPPSFRNTSKTSLLVVAIMTAVSASSACAHSEDSYSFSGLYISAESGLDHLGGTDEHSHQGVYGFGLGYDKPIGDFVIGAQGSASFSNHRDPEFNDVNEGVGPEFELNAGRDLTLSIRAGARIRNALAYLKVGYSNARFTTDHFEATAPFLGSRDLSGLRLGGGVELPIYGNWSARVEYHHTHYEYDIDRDQVLGGIALRL